MYVCAFPDFLKFNKFFISGYYTNFNVRYCLSTYNVYGIYVYYTLKQYCILK